MKVIVRVRGAAIGFQNGDIIIMMPVNIVDAAAVYVDFGAQVLDNDRRVLNVPGGTALPQPRCPTIWGRRHGTRARG